MRPRRVLSGFTMLPLLILGLPFTVQAQMRGDEGFSKLAEENRTALLLRLKSYVEAIRTEQWEHVYDYYWASYVDSVSGLNKATKDAYVQAKVLATGRKEVKFHDFLPAKARLVSFENEGITVVIIEGCGEYVNLKKHGQTTKALTSVTAVLENNTWYFENIAPLHCLDCPRSACEDNKTDRLPLH